MLKNEKLKSWKIWINDYDLLSEYMKLYSEFWEQLPHWLERPNSRNNVVSNNKTCIAWIQKLGSNLYVIQRSQDLLAKQWDKEQISYLAKLACCKNIYHIQLHEHYY